MVSVRRTPIPSMAEMQKLEIPGLVPVSAPEADEPDSDRVLPSSVPAPAHVPEGFRCNDEVQISPSDLPLIQQRTTRNSEDADLDEDSNQFLLILPST